MRRKARDRKSGLTHEGRIFLYTAAAALPAVASSLVILWIGGYSAKVQWTVSVVVVGAWLGFAFAVRERVVRPLQTLANLLAALREDDYSIRGRHDRSDDALGSAMAEVNALGAALRDQRLGAIEASALLGKVLAAIDVAIFAFDDAHQPLAVDEFHADTVWFACHHVQLQLVVPRIQSSNSNTI